MILSYRNRNINKYIWNIERQTRTFVSSEGIFGGIGGGRGE